MRPIAVVPDDWSSGYVELCVQWPDSVQWRAILRGLLAEPGNLDFWDALSGDPETAITAIPATLDNNLHLEDCMKFLPGMMMLWPAATPPTGWLLWNGDEVLRADYPELWAALDPLWATDGTHFQLGPGAGKFPVGLDVSSSFATDLEGSGGADTVTLSTTQIPSHNHTQDSHGHTQDTHNHTQNGHGHTQDTHNHTQNGHGHTQDAHLHVQDTHNHTQNSHTHTQNAHSHDALINSKSVYSGATSVVGAVNVNQDNTFSVGGNQWKSQSLIASNLSTTPTNITVVATNQNTTPTNQTKIATNQNATATNQSTTPTNNTVVATNQSTTPTNNTVVATNQATVATCQATGGGTSHTNIPPFFVVNFIVKT